MVDGLVRGQGMFKNIKRKLRQIVRTFPGAIELLPRYNKAAVFNDDSDVNFLKQKDWQENLFVDGNDYEKNLTKKFKQNLLKAKEDLAVLDKWIESLNNEDKKKILVVVRDEFETTQAVRVDESNKNEVNLRYAAKSKQGDGVVPHASACYYCKELLTLAIEDSFWYDDDSHAFVMTEERVQHLVSWFFDDTQKFDYTLPGNTVRKVKSLSLVKDSRTNLSCYEIEKV